MEEDEEKSIWPNSLNFYFVELILKRKKKTNAPIL